MDNLLSILSNFSTKKIKYYPKLLMANTKLTSTETSFRTQDVAPHSTLPTRKTLALLYIVLSVYPHKVKPVSWQLARRRQNSVKTYSP
jgi:hypothetical protein